MQLVLSELDVLDALNKHKTDLSTLTNFMSDNPNAIVKVNTNNNSTLIRAAYPESEIVFDTRGPGPV